MTFSLPRLALAGVVGGAIMFAWSAIAHMFLPIGTMGISSAPPAVISALREQLSTHAVYVFPGFDEKNATQAETDAYNAAYEAGPRGLIVYDAAPGIKSMGPSKLIAELLSSVAAAFLAAWILARLGETVLQKTCLAGLLGVIAWLSISASHGIWYRFPRAFLVGELLDQAVGWTLSGLAIALIVKPASRERA